MLLQIIDFLAILNRKYIKVYRIKTIMPYAVAFQFGVKTGILNGVLGL